RSLVETLTTALSMRGLEDQLLRKLGEGDGRIAGDEQRVLDPHAADAREVDAGLDRDDVAGRQGTTRCPGHPGRLVDLEPHAMTGPVHERVTETRLVDDRP